MTFAAGIWSHSRLLCNNSQEAPSFSTVSVRQSTMDSHCVRGFKQCNANCKVPSAPSQKRQIGSPIIEDLLHHIDEFQRVEEQKVMERLTKENAFLKRRIVCYTTSQNTAMNLLREVFEATILIRTALEESQFKELDARQDWLAFWGIYREVVEMFGHHSMTWI